MTRDASPWHLAIAAAVLAIGLLGTWLWRFLNP